MIMVIDVKYIHEWIEWTEFYSWRSKDQYSGHQFLAPPTLESNEYRNINLVLLPRFNDGLNFQYIRAIRVRFY